jgi:hypothetical protein
VQPEYPGFSPPLDPGDRKTWSKPDARRYFDWFLSELPIRIDRVSKYLGLDSNLSHGEQLEQAGQVLARRLGEPVFSRAGELEEATLNGHKISYQTGPLLTATGSSLAIDVGLLMASFLQEEFPSLHWMLVTHPRSYVSFNLPVLAGFGQLELDPLLTALSSAHGILAGLQSPSVFLEAYSWWRSHVA